MNAKEMNKITKQVKREKEAQEELKKQKAKKAKKVWAAWWKIWWYSEGIPEILDRIEIAAKQGEYAHEEIIDCCPDYVITALEDRGFKTQLTSEKRGRYRLSRGDGDSWERYYVHVLVVSW